MNEQFAWSTKPKQYTYTQIALPYCAGATQRCQPRDVRPEPRTDHGGRLSRAGRVQSDRTLAWTLLALPLWMAFSMAAGTRMSHFSSSRSSPLYGWAPGKLETVPCSSFQSSSSCRRAKSAAAGQTGVSKGRTGVRLGQQGVSRGQQQVRGLAGVSNARRGQL